MKSMKLLRPTLHRGTSLFVIKAIALLVLSGCSGGRSLHGKKVPESEQSEVVVLEHLSVLRLDALVLELRSAEF